MIFSAIATITILTLWTEFRNQNKIDTHFSFLSVNLEGIPSYISFKITFNMTINHDQGYKKIFNVIGFFSIEALTHFGLKAHMEHELDTLSYIPFLKF